MLAKSANINIIVIPQLFGNIFLSMPCTPHGHRNQTVLPMVPVFIANACINGCQLLINKKECSRLWTNNKIGQSLLCFVFDYSERYIPARLMVSLSVPL